MNNTTTFKSFTKSQKIRLRRLSKEVILIATGQALAVLGALVGVRIMTELLNPTAYGKLALGLTMATLVNSIILGPLSSGATRFFAPALESNNLKPYLRSILNLLLNATGFILLIMILGAVGLFALQKHQWAIVLIATMIYAIMSGYNSVLNGIQNAARQRTVVALHRAIESWGKYSIAAIFILWLGASSSVALIGYCIAVVLVLVSQSFFFKNKIIVKIKGLDRKKNDYQEQKKQILEYSWPFATWGVFLWAFMASGKWSLQFFSTTEEVGYFSVLFQLGYYPVITLAAMINQFLAPIYFQRAGDGTDLERVRGVYAIARRVAVLSLLGLIILVVILFFSHELIFRYLTAGGYSNVSHLMPFMVINSGLLVIAQFFTLALHNEKKTKFLILPKNIFYTIGSILIFLGAALYGMQGVIYASIFASLFHLIWIVAIFERNSRKFL